MPYFRSKFKKRAAIFGALFLFYSSQGFATKIETYKDLIEKSYTLSLQKDRTQAVAILISAIKRESSRALVQTPPPRELLAALDDVSTLFYSDKAQQLYELALSLKISDPALARVKLNEAAKVENDNLNIQIEIIRMQIATGECSAAYAQINKIIETNPYSEFIKLHMAQAAVCAGKLEYFKINKPLDLKKNTLAPFWHMVEVEYLFKTNELIRAQQLSNTVAKSYANYPEPLYWQWKIAEEKNENDSGFGQKYVSVCKKLTARQIREYSGDPTLCRRISEVENHIKKNNNPDI